MPGGDGTGPMGMGPMTGRAAGYCAGSAVPGFMNAPGGRGLGGRGFGGSGFGGRGGGRGWRNWYYATGLTGWQRTAAAMPAFGVGQFAPAAQTGPTTQTGPAASPAANQGQELNILMQQAEAMMQQMKQLQERIEKLETGN